MHSAIVRIIMMVTSKKPDRLSPYLHGLHKCSESQCLVFTMYNILTHTLELIGSAGNVCV